MPRGALKGERRGGRAKGTLNRATLERALQMQSHLNRARETGHDLAKTVLDKYMMFFVKYSMKFKPSLDGEDENPSQNIDEFYKWAGVAIDCASKLAPYQSPTFKAVVVAPAPEPSGKVTEVTLRIFEADSKPMIEYKRTIDEEIVS
jgi:hypothetical protein